VARAGDLAHGLEHVAAGQDAGHLPASKLTAAVAAHAGPGSAMIRFDFNSTGLGSRSW
jgi:hypothetical protein